MTTSLALTWDDLRREVGFYLGYCPGRDLSVMSDAESATVNARIDSGLRRFYFQAILPGMSKGHEWSFLRPVGSLTTAADTYKYDLPLDFGGFDGAMTIESSTSYRPLRRTGITEIMRNQGLEPTLTSCPVVFADAPKVGSGVLEQSFEVWFSPTPDQAYDMRFVYRVNPKRLSSSRPHPYGGVEHSETILQACLAACERIPNDSTEGGHESDYQRCLASSISLDLAHKPDFFGYNGDGSIDRSAARKPFSQVYALYNGQMPEDYTA